MDNILKISSLRKKLEDEQCKLQANIAVRLSRQNEGRNPDRSDLAQSYTSRERDTALLAMERQQLKQVQDALQRLEDGTYGQCTACGNSINPERLDILPYATLCVSCQAGRE